MKHFSHEKSFNFIGTEKLLYGNRECSSKELVVFGVVVGNYEKMIKIECIWWCYVILGPGSQQI